MQYPGVILHLLWQNPQCLLSNARFTHSPLQHSSVKSHLCLHAPQLFLSDLRSMHLLLQQVVFVPFPEMRSHFSLSFLHLSAALGLVNPFCSRNRLTFFVETAGSLWRKSSFEGCNDGCRREMLEFLVVVRIRVTAMVMAAKLKIILMITFMVLKVE